MWVDCTNVAKQELEQDKEKDFDYDFDNELSIFEHISASVFDFPFINPLYFTHSSQK